MTEKAVFIKDEFFKKLKAPSDVPCVRASVLTGIAIGCGVSAIQLTRNRNGWKALRYGRTGFIVGTIANWFVCRHNYNIKMEKAQEAFDEQKRLEAEEENRKKEQRLKEFKDYDVEKDIEL